jgi:O-acetyl-ADP-ribose deacetylase (regulator of RNase III)
VVSGSIRRVRFAEVWVNPENTDMEMPRITEFSISAIIRYGGARLDQAGRVTEDLIADELAAAVGQRRPVAPGTAVVTGAGRLTETHNVHFVIHVAGVQGEPGAGFRQIRNIGDCVTNALDQADRLTRTGHQASTVLVPVLGVGMGGRHDMTSPRHSPPTTPTAPATMAGTRPGTARQRHRVDDELPRRVDRRRPTEPR